MAYAVYSYVDGGGGKKKKTLEEVQSDELNKAVIPMVNTAAQGNKNYTGYKTTGTNPTYTYNIVNTANTQDALSQYQEANAEKEAEAAYQSSLKNSESIYDTQRNLTDENYETALNSLNAQQRAVLEALGLTKRNQQRGAYVNLEKLLKYLPEYLQRQGLSGLGISASSVIDAYGQYQDALNAIEEQNQNTVSQYETQRLSDVASLEQNKANALASYNLQKIQRDQGYLDNYLAYLAKAADEDKNADGTQATSGAEYFTDSKSGDDDIYSGGSSGTSGSKVNVVAEKAKTNNGKNTAGDGFFLGWGSDWNDRENDNLSATIDGKKYKLQTGDALTKKETDEVKSALGGKVSPNTVLLYDGKLVVSTDSGALRYIRTDKDFNRRSYSDLMKYLKS